MPEIARFYGIVIRIFYDDHNPPHFHAEYGEHEVLVNINTLAVLGGGLPARELPRASARSVLLMDETASAVGTSQGRRCAGCARPFCGGPSKAGLPARTLAMSRPAS
jgi:hypothetical protein